MTSKDHFTRIDIAEIKALIYKKIGYERANLYFNILTQYLNSKISKIELSKICMRTLQRENLHLHNRLIRSILTNASLSKAHPPPKIAKSNEPLNARLINKYQTKRRSRSSRPSKFRERPSPLGPLGKTTSPTVDKSPTELNSLGSRARAEDGEEVEQITVVHSRSSIMAPIGVSLNLGCSFKKKISFQDATNDLCSMMCRSSGVLPDAMSLRAQLEQRLSSDGIGVSEDCVNLLNNGLNVYLKRLIEPGMELAKSRFGFCKKMSMLDFRVLMESNRSILGEDWPIQLEKICSRSYEE